MCCKLALIRASGDAMHHRYRLGFLRACMATVALAALSLVCVITEPAKSQTVTYFDANLSPYGYWIDDPIHGRAWRPRETPADWRPYTYGRWVYTSEYGWVWVSEEPYGWVVYHYGRWVWTARYGWIWIAGETWGPAWVEWCYGGGYVGWTPMPPDPHWQGYFYYGSFDCTAPRTYSRTVFVAEASFTSPRLSSHVVVSSQNAVIARRSVNVTSYARTGDSITNSGLDIAKLRAATGQPILPVRVVHTKAPAGDPSSAILRELRIYRPAVSPPPAPKLGADRPLKIDLDPPLRDMGTLPPSPADAGTLTRIPADRSLDAPSLPSLGGSGNPGLGGGGLGGVRGRLGR
jgi:hypothetical protein